MKLRVFIASILLIGVFFFATKNVGAVQYSLIAPEGQLTRGQPVTFTINIDTEGQSLTAATIGMTYKSDVLQYVSTTPGNTFPSVTATVEDSPQNINGVSTDKAIVFQAQNADGFSGTGTFATVTFNLIATAPGSTQLCVLFNPSSTPTPGPTSTTAPAVPQPTALPKTGDITLANQSTAAGGIFILLAAALFAVSKLSSKKHHKSLH